MSRKQSPDAKQLGEATKYSSPRKPDVQVVDALTLSLNQEVSEFKQILNTTGKVILKSDISQLQESGKRSPPPLILTA